MRLGFSFVLFIFSYAREKLKENVIYEDLGENFKNI